MSRTILGSIWDRGNRNELNRMLEELYSNLGTATGTKIKLDNFLNGSKVVDRTMLDDAAVGPSQLDNGAVSSSKIQDAAIGTRHLLVNAVTEEKIRDGSISSSKLSVDSVSMNKGKIYPLVNYDVNGIETGISQPARLGVLEAKVSGADINKVYMLKSIRHGYNGQFGINIDSFTLDTNRNIDTSTRKREISHATSVYPTFFTYNYGRSIGTVTARNDMGLIVTVKFDVASVGQLLNLAENELGTSQGAIIDPSNYEYKPPEELQINYNNMIVVDKNENDMIVYVKSKNDIYTGYHLYRVTTPFEQGNQQSNIDLWSIGRVSVYLRDGDSFTENANKVFVYSTVDAPTYTNDTIFKLAGANDYSGGFYHGDEKIQSFYIVVGNIDITNITGRFEGESIELLQHTHIYHDTSTSATGDSAAFLSVKKTHRFNQEDGYTLKTKLEALENFTPIFSSIGGWQMRRKYENGASNNITDAYDLTNISKVNLRVADTEDKHFSGQNTMEYKVIGYHKDILIKYESDSDYFDTWMRNWADNEMKIYSKVFEDDKEVVAGTVVNAALNCKITSY